MPEFLHRFPRRRNLHLIAPRMPQDQPPARRHQSRQVRIVQQPLRQGRRSPSNVFLPVRRIRNHQIKKPPHLPQRSQHREHILHPQFHPHPVQPTRLQVPSVKTGMTIRLLHTHQLHRPTAQHLQPQRPRPREQIQHARPVRPAAQTVEHRQLHLVRHRPHVEALRHRQHPSLRKTSNDPHVPSLLTRRRLETQKLGS